MEGPCKRAALPPKPYHILLCVAFFSLPFLPLRFVAEISSLGGNSSAQLKCCKLPYFAYILFCLHIGGSGHRNVSLQVVADSQ